MRTVCTRVLKQHPLQNTHTTPVPRAWRNSTTFARLALQQLAMQQQLQQQPHTTPPAASSDAASEQPGQRRPRVLLAVTGSVAAIKVPLLCELLLAAGCDVRVAATRAAACFFGEDALPAGVGAVVGDEAEWRAWARVGDPVLHIELRRWADVLLFAPLSANTLAKLAYGLCDNLVTCVARAWDYQRPLLVAPAMNTLMWDSPFTAQHLSTLTQLGVVVVPPVAKALACGDVGNGAMAAPETIVQRVQAALVRLELPLPPTGSTAAAGANQQQQQEQQHQAGVVKCSGGACCAGCASGGGGGDVGCLQ